MTELPRILTNLHPAPGLIKQDYTDFVVEEVPLYPADGDGTHTYFLLEKAGLGTLQAIADLARALNVRRHDIGFAGLKDARAVTRQWMSIEHIQPEQLERLSLPRLRILEITRHRNKIRLGHLKANHFVIKVRQTEPNRLAELQDGLAQLAQTGLPNWFGAQRFGYRGDTWAIGRAIVKQQPDEAIDLLLGRATAADSGPTRHARNLYDHGRFAEAARTWPAMFHTERRALNTLARGAPNRRKALASIDRTTRNFYVSAYQSHLFNQVVAARLPMGLATLQVGDLAWRHASGAVFRVEDTAAEQPRADAFEISPSGPLFGYRMTEPTGEPAAIEAAILAHQGLEPDAFRAGRLRVKGSRRAMRFRPEGPRLSLGADERGPYLELEFMLPRGCYATALLRELFVPADADALASEETEEPTQ